jgi:hypothetical protein
VLATAAHARALLRRCTLTASAPTRSTVAAVAAARHRAHAAWGQGGRGRHQVSGCVVACQAVCQACAEHAHISTQRVAGSCWQHDGVRPGLHAPTPSHHAPTLPQARQPRQQEGHGVGALSQRPRGAAGGRQQRGSPRVSGPMCAPRLAWLTRHVTHTTSGCRRCWCLMTGSGAAAPRSTSRRRWRSRSRSCRSWRPSGGWCVNRHLRRRQRDV